MRHTSFVHAFDGYTSSRTRTPHVRDTSTLAAFAALSIRNFAMALFALAVASSGFTVAPAASAAVNRFAARSVQPNMNGAFLALEAVEPAVTSYVNIWVPLFESAKESGLAPDFLLHWGHGAAMSTVLFAMGGYGAFTGWQTRLGNGETVYPLSLGETAREIHPLSLIHI